jgi:putative glycosyl hydrolase
MAAASAARLAGSVERKMCFRKLRRTVLLIMVVSTLSLLSCVLLEVDPPDDQATATPQPVSLITDVPSPTNTVSSLPTPWIAPSASPIGEDVLSITVDFGEVIGKSPEFYGVEYSWIDQEQDLYLERYSRLHANIIRVQIPQAFFEPINDNNDPHSSEIDFSVTLPVDSREGTTLTFERMFKTLAVEFPSMHFHIGIWLPARWNAKDPEGYLGVGGAFPPQDLAEHKEFVQALARWLVSDCDISPERLSFSFINEPNLPSFFVGAGADLIQLAEVTRDALDQVSPHIKMGGIDEVHGTLWTDRFFDRRPDGCCEMWTFHVYERGSSDMWSVLQERSEHLGQYGPVWVTEFADITYGSPDAKMDFSTREAALQFADLLGKLWLTEIEGVIHFRLSDTYADLAGGWAGHGLFADGRGTHSGGDAYEPFPAYWVFANMYRELGGSRIVRVVAPRDLTVVGARKESGSETRLAIWVANTTTASYDVAFNVANFPGTAATVQVFNNLTGDAAVETRSVAGTELVFRAEIPRQSSYLFVFSGPQTPPE